MYKMKISHLNDLGEEWSTDLEYENIEAVRGFILPLLRDFALNGYRVTFDDDQMEVVGHTFTIFYKWHEVDTKLQKLMNKPSPFV